MKQHHYEEYAASSLVSEGVSSRVELLCISAAHRTDHLSCHITAAVSMNTFIVIFILLLSEPSWPRRCCGRVLSETKTHKQHQTIWYMRYNKLRLYWLGKWSFNLTHSLSLCVGHCTKLGRTYSHIWYDHWWACKTKRATDLCDKVKPL